MLELLSICALYALSEVTLCRSEYFDAKSNCQYYYAFDREAEFDWADEEFKACGVEARSEYKQCRKDVESCDY